jgi:hypothetical protein
MQNLFKTFFIIICIVIHEYSIGQTILMQENVNDIDFKAPSQGPNYRHFGHLFIGFGFYIPDGGDFEVETKAIFTTSFEFGWRYKLKLTNWLAIGTGINYYNDIFNIKQVDDKVVPTNIKHSKERLRYNNLGTEIYMRFNFGKRGNVIGRFLDVGAYGNWAFAVNHMYEDKSNSQLPYMAGSERVILYHLSYVEKYNYGLKARIGINRYVITAMYRMNDLLTQEYRDDVGDYYFPKLAVGFELGLHK